VARYPPALKIWNCFYFLYFVAFAITSFSLGGDALLGGTYNGHYYLALSRLGHRTEVSRAVFEFSLWQVYALGWIGAITGVLNILHALLARRR
jgi:hypothetical protein